MFVTLECPPVGRGNVCIFTRSCHFIDFPLASKFMQCKVGFFFIALYFELRFVLDYAINNKLTPFISMQNHYNLLYREEEREMLPTLKVIYSHYRLASPLSQ